MAYISNQLIKEAETYLGSLHQKASIEEILNTHFDFINKSINTDQTLIDFYNNYFAHTYGDVKLENLDLHLNPYRSYDKFDSIRAYSDYFYKIDPSSEVVKQMVMKNQEGYNTYLYPLNETKLHHEWYYDFFGKSNAHQTIMACYQISPNLVVRYSISRKETSPLFNAGEYKILKLVGNGTMNATRNLIRLMNVQNYRVEKDNQIKNKNEQISLFNSVFNYIKEYLFLFDENYNSVFITLEAVKLIEELKNYPVQMSTINNLLLPSQLVFKIKSFVRKHIDCKTEPTLSDYLTEHITFLKLYTFEITFAKIIPENNTDNKMYFMVRLVPQNIKSKLMLLKHKYLLTQREYDVTEHLLFGKTINETAYVLGISLNTVKSHIKNIFFKLNIKSIKEIYLMLK